MPVGRVLAVDWSGDRRAETEVHPKLWLAEVEGGELVGLAPSSRAGTVAAILAAADADPSVVVGLDFSFGLPAWFADRLGVRSGPALWERAAALLDDPPEPPFFGRAGTHRPPPDQLWRRTEVAARAAGWRVGSTFQLTGPGRWARARCGAWATWRCCGRRACGCGRSTTSPAPIGDARWRWRSTRAGSPVRS